MHDVANAISKEADISRDKSSNMQQPRENTNSFKSDLTIPTSLFHQTKVDMSINIIYKLL